jgi:hypothetical protein
MSVRRSQEGRAMVEFERNSRENVIYFVLQSKHEHSEQNMNYAKWITHFKRNRDHRPEPDWASPVTVHPAVLPPLLKSIEQFRLGDGGGPASLIAHDADRFRNRSEELCQIVDMWFAEEAEHARLLGCAVKRFRGRYITGHWSFTAFCFCRRIFGVRFELQVLLLTELVSTAYYRLLRNHSPDGALTAMCELIQRDEASHVSFHRDRLADTGCLAGVSGALWQAQFRLFGYAAAMMLWVNHRPGLTAIGGSGAEYFRDVRRQLQRFIFSLRRASAPIRIKAKWAVATPCQ